MKGPGAELFEAVQQTLGDLPIVAETLGVITPEVRALRDRFGFPGMGILQFAFGSDPQGPDFRPHNYHRNFAVYTGTHDKEAPAPLRKAISKIKRVPRTERYRYGL